MEKAAALTFSGCCSKEQEQADLTCAVRTTSSFAAGANASDRTMNVDWFMIQY